MAFFGLRNALSGIPGFRALCGALTIAMLRILASGVSIQDKIIYPPSLLLALRHVSGEGGGGVFFEAPRRRNFVPPPSFIRPTPRRVLSGVGGWACIKLCAVFH